MPRLALTEPSIGSTTTAAGRRRRTRARRAPRRRASDRASRRLEARHDRLLGRRVDRGRVVATLAGAQHGLALGACGQRGEGLVEVRDARTRQNASQSITDRPGGRAARRRASGRSRSSSAASARRGAPARRRRRSAAGAKKERAVSLAGHRRALLPRAGPACTRARRDRSDRRARRRARPARRGRARVWPARHAHRRRTIGGSRLERARERPRRCRIGSPSGSMSSRPVKTRCVGRISRPGSDVETSTASSRSAPASLRRTRPRSRSGGARRRSAAAGRRRTPGLPVVVQRARAACRRRRVSGSPGGRWSGGCPVVEQENRLELRARRAQQPQPALDRAAMRPLVREHGAASRTARPAATRRCRPAPRATPSGST